MMKLRLRLKRPRQPKRRIRQKKLLKKFDTLDDFKDEKTKSINKVCVQPDAVEERWRQVREGIMQGAKKAVGKCH